MKKISCKLGKLKLLPAAAALASALLATQASANMFWDPTGTTLSPTADGTWENNVWATSGVPIASPLAYIEGSFVVFSTTGNGATSVSCTVNANHTFAGMYNGGTGSATTCANLLINGPGILSFSGVQGFNTSSGGNTHIAVTLAGTGTLQTAGSSSGQLYLEGTNTFAGGVNLNSTLLVNYNNAASFGTGTINMNSGGSGDALIPETGPLTITNNFAVNVAFSCNMVGHSSGITWSGNIALGANTLTIGCGGGVGVSDIFSGVISGSGGLGRQSSASHGTVKLSGANTYTGKTLIQSSVTSVSSLNSVSTPAPQPSSNLGAPSSAANGTLGIGATTFTGTLLYTGPGETTDRIIDLAGTTGGATIQASGTGALVFTSPNTASGVGLKTLTLQGTSIAANTIAGRIVDSSSAATRLAKAQAGKWVLSGTNTYTGGTTITLGTLEIGATGIIAGNVTNNGGVLQLDSNKSLNSSAAVALLSSLPSGSVNLNFSGSQIINALFIDGSLMASGTWGSPSSGAQNTSPIFTGTGLLNVLGAPVIVQQPQSLATYPDTANVGFSVVATGDPTFTYQWKLNGNSISGATDSSYIIPVVQTTDAGTYTVAITNNFGNAISAPAILNVLSTNLYVNTIRADGPISYWRLDEATGSLAQDGIGNNNGLYVNVTLGQPGFSLTDPDTSVGLPSTNTAARSYVQVTNFTPFIFNSATPFTLEGWAYFTNLTTKGRLFSTLSLGAPGGFAFGVLAGGTALELTAGGVADKDSPTLANPLVPGVWYYLVCTYDGNNYTFYVNTNMVGSPSAAGGFIPGVAVPLTMGANPSAYTFAGGDNGAEQIHGRIDEMAIYNYALNNSQVLAHFAARYGSLQPPVVSTPIANPPTNYVSLSATIQAVAGGQALSYQWYKGATLLAGQTDETLTLAPLDLTNNGNYTVVVSNPAGTNTSPAVTLTVLSIPTNAADLNLTSGLVLHLPFDGGYNDISGHNNNGANVGATFFTNGVIGADSLHYFTTSGSTNYVTLGVVPDLQFGSATDFTVSYWVRQPAGSTYTNLPFFTDAIGSTGHGGFAFAPYQTATTSGGWILSIGSMSTPSAFTSFPDADLINDGNWHNLVHVASRVAGVTTYLDGVQVDSEAISFVGNINTTNAATIGQDPTGAYPVTADADLDDLGVWRRTLTPLEVSGLYLAGISNSVSFAPAVTITSSVTISNLSGTTLAYGGGSGTRFVLLSTADVAAPVSGWTRTATNTVTPGSFTIPAVGTAALKYYLIKSE